MSYPKKFDGELINKSQWNAVIDALHKTASYIIYKEDVTIYALNGSSGKIDYSGTDASTVIQSAIDALTNGRTWKEKVVLKGDFEIGAKIRIPSYTILEILGKVKLANNVNAIMFDNDDYSGGNSDIEIIGGELDGNKANQTTGHGIYFNNVSRVIIRGIYVHNCKDDGIKLESCSEAFISEALIESNDGNGLVLKTTTDSQITDIVSNSNGSGTVGEGLYIHTNSLRNRVENSEFNSNNKTGITISITSTNNQMVNCIVKGNGDSGILTKSQKLSLIGIIGIDNTYDGITLDADSDYSTIVGGVFYDNKRNGITVYRSSYCTVAGNVVFNNAVNYVSGGIRLHDGGSDPCLYCIISNNICFDTRTGASRTQDYGILSEDSSDYLLVEDNVLYNNIVAQVSLVGTNDMVKHNIGYVTENSGTDTFSGDGTTTVFNIPHGLASTPNAYGVSPLAPDADAARTITVDATNIIITYSTAPPIGTDNLKFGWWAEV